MPHFYVKPSNIDGNTFVMDKEQTHYLSNVRRICAGDEIKIFDGLGNSFTAKIDNIKKDSITGSIISKSSFSIPKLKISVYIAIPKGGRFEWFIEKASEIGVFQINPVITARSIVSDISDNKIERYKKISLSASSQCGRADIMNINKPVYFNEAVSSVTGKKENINIIPWESENNKTIDGISCNCKNISNINIFIGPEGGFENKEIETAIGNNIMPVTLGNNILRIETAALVASILVLNKFRILNNGLSGE